MIWNWWSKRKSDTFGSNILNIHFILPVWVLCLHLYLCMMYVWCLQRTEEGVQFPGARVRGSCEGTSWALRIGHGLSESKQDSPLSHMSNNFK